MQPKARDPTNGNGASHAGASHSARPLTDQGFRPAGDGERARVRRVVRPMQIRRPHTSHEGTPLLEADPAAPFDQPRARLGAGRPPAGAPAPARWTEPGPGAAEADYNAYDGASHDALDHAATRHGAPEFPLDGAPEPFDGRDPAAEDGSSGIVGSDGRIDFDAKIRRHAKSVWASELAARHDRVHVLDLGTIRRLMQEAVAEASSHFQRALNESDRTQLLEEAEEGFKERLKAFEAEKLSSDSRLAHLLDQLGLAQKTLEEERARAIKAEQFTVSASGLDEIEKKFKRLLERSIAEGRVVPSLEEELRKVIATVFDAERARIREMEMKAQNEKIQLLEAKIKRLSTALEDTERQRDAMQEWARLMEAQGGGALHNVYFAGMKDGDPNKKRKLALMKEILDINRAIRKDLGIETKPVDEETLEAIKKVEAEAVLTDEEKERIRMQRLLPEPEIQPDAEMANVIAEGVDGAGDAGGAAAADTHDQADGQEWEAGRRTINAGAGTTKVTADGVEALEEGALVNPDDLPWQPNGAPDHRESNGSSVKKISADPSVRIPRLERQQQAGRPAQPRSSSPPRT